MRLKLWLKLWPRLLALKVATMTLWICIHQPFHTLDSNVPQWRTNAPIAAVWRDDKVIACTPDAYKNGVRPGMNRTAAAARVAGIRLVQHDPRCAQHRLESIATTLLQYTPELALFDSSSLLLDVGASLSLFKGPRNLFRRIQTSLGLIKTQAHISMAPTAAGAWLIARQKQTRQRRILSMGSLVHHLDTLHISNLPVVRPYLSWLTGLGCTTLKDLTQLPRAGLTQRTSLQVVRYLDAAYGKTTLPLSWYQPTDVFHASCILEFHTQQVHSLLNAAQGLIEQLCGWLQARHQAASSLQFSLRHEKGRHACPPTCVTLNLSAPSRHAKDFLLLLNENLQHEHLQAPVIAIDLHNVQSQSESEPSGDLFPDRTQHRHQENRLVDVLRARLGHNNVLEPRPIASYLPEVANQWVALGLKANANYQNSNAECPTNASFPFWMLEDPIKLATFNDRPIYQGHALHLIQGPERIESGWWMQGKQEQRDYFVARDSQYCRYWVYRQRGSDNPHWFLHGLFA